MRALLLSLVVGLGSLGLTLGTPTPTRAAVPPVVYTSSFEPVAYHWHRGYYGGWGGGYYRPFYRGYYGRGYYRPFYRGYYGGWGYPAYSSYYYGGYPGYSSYYYGGYPYGGLSTPWFSLWW